MKSYNYSLKEVIIIIIIFFMKTDKTQLVT